MSFQRRGDYLHLLAGLVGAGGWKEHMHRREEVIRCCTNIMAEERDRQTLTRDQHLVKVIMDAHPDFFMEG